MFCLAQSTILDSGNRAPRPHAHIQAHRSRAARRADYTKMMELVDGAQILIKLSGQWLSAPLLTDLGFKVFETINITLVCDECLKGDCNGHPSHSRL